ncbi:HECT-like ubiquitin-conjugating enzyme (E2)-binding protein [Tasmannia lanceolata]|uniref:HECT-like ubiquitin-conjugating enzyme (E2)-binding protein n=1 Tax=Tasmannia lanceolata TaxID=3420 RepID=UPI004064690B
MPSSSRNPRKWRFTWEALAHIPTLRLFLFNQEINPFNQCKNLKSSLNFEQSSLLLSWIEETGDQNEGSVDFLIRVPVPRVLIDLSSPVDSKAKDDHIEVKLVLLLPLDHPLVANFDSVLNPEGEGFSQDEGVLDRFLPLSLDSDLKSLSSGGGVHFYCKSCSTKLTKEPLRSFVEMPSVDWREVADNWFGSCCCSFGGISEKLVSRYADSYISEEGICLLDGTSVIISKDDLSGYAFPDSSDGNTNCNSELDLVVNVHLTDDVVDSGGYGSGGICCGNGNDGPTHICEALDSLSLNEERSIAGVQHGLSLEEQHHCCISEINCAINNAHERPSDIVSVTSLKNQKSTKIAELQTNQKSPHNGSLGSGFMVRNSNLSNDIEWVDFVCNQCSSLLGSYPSVNNGNAPVDGGVRLFKCYISTSVPVCGSGNIFRKHTMQRVFVNRLMESATDELSFRTVVRDLRTKNPMLQIVLLNSKAWCCTGYCLDSENGTTEPVSKMDLHPVVKVSFSECSTFPEAESRKIEEWATKNQADEVYMMSRPIIELTQSLKSAQESLPFSCSFLQGFSLSYMER